MSLQDGLASLGNLPMPYSEEAQRIRDAAPDLLAALKLWLDYDNQDEADFSQIGPMLLYDNALEATRQSVDKATGK